MQRERLMPSVDFIPLKGDIRDGEGGVARLADSFFRAIGMALVREYYGDEENISISGHRLCLQRQETPRRNIARQK